MIEVLSDEGNVADTTSYGHEDLPLAASDYSRRITESLDSVVFKSRDTGD